MHAAQSAALLAGGELDAALPGAGAVRTGLLLYGVRPAAHLGAGLAPAMTLSTRVVHVRTLRGGDAVGYAALWHARRATRIATLALGYADGLPIAASNRGQVWLRGRLLPLVGRVSMDFVGVDAGDAPVEIGDEAIVFGVTPGAALPDRRRSRAPRRRSPTSCSCASARACRACTRLRLTRPRLLGKPAANHSRLCFREPA